MDLGPDGSLCRITSSIKEPNNIMIVTLPSTGLPDVPMCKLVVIGAEKHVSESSSEESSENEADNVLKEEENKKNYTDSNRNTKGNNDRKNKSPERNANLTRSQLNDVNDHRSQNRHRNHNFNAGRRNYNRSGNMPKLRPSLDNVEVWVTPQAPQAFFSPLPARPIFPGPTQMELPMLPNPNLETNMAKKSLGLLGESPYSSVPPQFYEKPFPFYNNNMHPNSYLRSDPIDRNPMEATHNYDETAANQSYIPYVEGFDPIGTQRSCWNEGPPNSEPRPVHPGRQNPATGTYGKVYNEPTRLDSNYSNKHHPNSYRPGRKNPTNATRGKNCDEFAAKQNPIPHYKPVDPDTNYQNEGHRNTYLAPGRHDRKIPMKETRRKNYRQRGRFNQGFRGKRENISGRWEREQPNNQERGNYEWRKMDF